jgi:hypothetical protein
MRAIPRVSCVVSNSISHQSPTVNCHPMTDEHPFVDLHDPMPELFSSIYDLPFEHAITKLP